MNRDETAPEPPLQSTSGTSSSRDRRDYDGRPQHTELRRYIQRANTAADRPGLRKDLRKVETALSALEAELAEAPATERPVEWYRHHEQLGSLCGALAKWEVGAEVETFEKALAHFDKAVQAPRGLSDVFWGTAHNNKGAIQYWYAIWLAGGDQREVTDDPPPERFARCTELMLAAVGHYTLALDVRRRAASTPENDAGSHQFLAQTLQNMGTAWTPLAAWQKRQVLAKRAIRYLEEVEPLKRLEFVEEAFPDLDQDIQDARTVLANLTGDRDSGDNIWPDNELERPTVNDESNDKPQISPSLGRDFSSASLDEIWGEFMAPASESAVKRLESIVQEAQISKPRNPRTFAIMVNDIMITKGLRFQLGTPGELARLRVTNNSLQFVRKGRSGGVSFQQDFRIVRDSDRPEVETNRPGPQPS